MYDHRPRLGRSFYSRDTLRVARELLGKRLVHESEEGLTVGEIVETEAYIGPYDRASHAFRGRRTPHVEVQYRPSGHAYVYTIHGRQCFDITTGREGSPEVVLIRALRPVHGLELMANRRKINIAESSEKRIKELCNGPCKLCEAMGINGKHYGIDLCGNVIYLEEGLNLGSNETATTHRIGIDYAGEAKDYSWRFCITDCRYVSKPAKTMRSRSINRQEEHNTKQIERHCCRDID